MSNGTKGNPQLNLNVNSYTQFLWS